MKKKSIRKNAILNILRTIVGIIFPLISFPYISRVLQVEAIGVYNFSSSIISYFLLIAGLGISTYAIREGVVYRSDKSKLEEFITEVFSINVISTLFSYVMLFVVIYMIDKLNNYSNILLILSLEIIFTTISISWVCNIFEDFEFIAIQSIGIQVLSLLLILFLVKKPTDIYIYVWITVISKGISALINIIYIRVRYCRIRICINRCLLKHLKPILIIFFTGIAITVYVSADTTMIGMIKGDYQVGLYSIAVRIYSIVKNILQAALVVLIPRFALILNNKDYSAEDLNGFFSKVFKTLLFIMVPAVWGLFLVSEDVIHLIGGENYLTATGALRFLCIALLFSLFAYMYTQCILIPLKMEKILFWATLISAVINIGLNIVVIPIWGINGAAITTIIAEFVVWIISVVYSRKNVSLVDIKGDIYKILMGCAGIFIIQVLCYRLFENYILRLMMTIGISIIVYISIEMLVMNSVIKDYIPMLRKYLRFK